MTENTTRDLAKYVARGRVNVRQIRPVRPAVAVTVWPMCERCGIRSDTVRPRRRGVFAYWTRDLCTACHWRA